MDMRGHKITFKLHIPAQGPFKDRRRCFVVCSCRSESYYEDAPRDLFGWILAHLIGAKVLGHARTVDDVAFMFDEGVFDTSEMGDPMAENPPTSFIEANALLALQSGDKAAAKRCINGMHPNELRALKDAAKALWWLCGDRLGTLAETERQEV